MTSPHKSSWAIAFSDQAKLDLDLATALATAIRDKSISGILGEKPQLYRPAIYAYCQQALEKALKAWLWHARGRIPRIHNPLPVVLASKEMRSNHRPAFLAVIGRNKASLGSILNMAPGASSGRNATLEQLLQQPNTEYPCAVQGRVLIPHEHISLGDVAAALKIAGPLVDAIRKYLEVQNLAPSRL